MSLVNHAPEQDTQPPQAPARKWYRKPIVLIPAVVITAAIAGGTVAGALGGTSHPANAAAMVKADGYTVAYNLTPAQVATEFGDAAPYVTSAAVGLDAKGNAEVDVYFTPQGITILNAGVALEHTTFSAALGQAVPGAAVTVNGDVIRMDAPASAVSGAGGLGTP